MISLNNREVLKKKIFSLQDEVLNKLSIDNDVDKFLDNTTSLDEWEEIIPDPEYGIFVIAVLNNIRNDKIINKILDAILNIKDSNEEPSILVDKNIEHPFC
tara:strand:- start:173 stop:475 length:303 start_codon:yes stop_codon:yes gene_type:complete